jgi:predicted nucleic acid-binding protein
VIVLDTNVVSELMRSRADARVVAWVDELPAGEVYLTAITTAELRYGVARLPEGSRRTDLADRVARMIEDDFAGRVLPFDDDAAAHFADVAAARERAGRRVTTADTQIAAICRSHGAELATRNTRDFVHTGVQLVDPWTAP